MEDNPMQSKTYLSTPYDSHKAAEIMRSFRDWAATQPEIESGSAPDQMIASFIEWLDAQPSIEERPLPFGMQFQQWPMAAPNLEGVYDPTTQTWKPAAQSNIDASINPAIFATNPLGSRTVDAFNTTSTTITFCFIIIPDDTSCVLDLRTD